MGFSKFLSRKLLQNGIPKSVLHRLTLRGFTGDGGCGVSDNVDDGCKGDKPLDGNKKGLVLGVFEGKNKYELSPAAEEINQASGGKICKYLNDVSSEMRVGKAFVTTDLVPEYSVVAITSFGPKEAAFNKLEEMDEFRENVRWGVGAGVRSVKDRGVGEVAVDGAGASDAAAEAAHLAAWRFQEFKSCSDQRPKMKVTPFGSVDGPLWEEGKIRGRAQNWARFMSDMPANKMTPVDLAEEAIRVLCPLGVKVVAHDQAWMEAQKMRALLAVARGSCETPVFLVCEYKKGNSAPVLLAAKGVTFDSGGLCLKSPKQMRNNRGSMAGAAVVLAALRTIAEMKLSLNVSAVIPLCENMVSGQCMKVGDVVPALNGLNIQIENTDMEGRLMLADALVYGQAVYKPNLVIDVATLTHGILLATGGGAFGCFSNNEDAWQAVNSAGAATGDRPWRFPLWSYYHNQITNEPAVDLRNKGSGKATPCIGAAFLRNFVCGDWVHMDITGVGKLAHAPAPPYLDPRRMTGRPTRTLATMLHNISKNCPDEKRS